MAPLVLLALLACDRSSSSGAIAPASSTRAPGAAPSEGLSLPGRARAPALSRLPGAVAEGFNGAVTSAEANASQVGLRVLQSGGNAVDAAVAVAFALGVTHPSAGNIGGGGFMLIRFPEGRSTAIDYREVAPQAARPDMFVNSAGRVTQDSELGPLAAGIPGVVAGLAFAHQKYGTRPWAELVTPAVELASRGWALDALHATELEEVSDSIREYLRHVPAASTALRAALVATLKTFERAPGESYVAGDIWMQPELAATLERIARGGAGAFYAGPLALDMASKVRGMGGIWSAADLGAYRVVERSPLVFSYRDHEVVAMPPPSSGGIALAQIFSAAESSSMHELDWDSVQRIHLYVEVLRRTFADRSGLIADPAFVRVPVGRLMDRAYVQQRMADIDPKQATPSRRVGPGLPPAEPVHTTHFSVVDLNGMAVANTYTLNGDFGAKVQIEGTGVTLNNEMDDFTAQVGAPNQFGLVQGAQNAVMPGKRMLSSMSPTILVANGKLRAVLGSPGGPTIISTVAQIAMQLVDYDRTLEQAVGAVRIHHQWLPDQIYYEPALPEATVQGLSTMGHQLVQDGYIGHANCIEIDPKSGLVRAVADVTRYGGKAIAY